MTNQTLNLFIVEEDAKNALKLHHFLETRFGTVFNIFTFSDPVTALSKVDKDTSVVVLDYNYFGEQGNEIIDFIKCINQKTQVIILSNNEEIYGVIDGHMKNGDHYFHKEKGLKKKLSATILKIVTYPANYLQMKYSVSQFFIYLIFLFVVVGILVFFGMITIF